jgi:hypothetical protein
MHHSRKTILRIRNHRAKFEAPKSAPFAQKSTPLPNNPSLGRLTLKGRTTKSKKLKLAAPKLVTSNEE